MWWRGQDLNLRPSGYEYGEKNDFHQYLCGLEGSGANLLAVGCQLRKIPTPDPAAFSTLPQAAYSVWRL